MRRFGERFEDLQRKIIKKMIKESIIQRRK